MSKSITQKMKYKQSVIKFSFKYGVKEAAKKFNEWPKTIYRWIERYDGSIESLADKSRRPLSHPNQHTEAEIKLIKDYIDEYNAYVDELREKGRYDHKYIRNLKDLRMFFISKMELPPDVATRLVDIYREGSAKNEVSDFSDIISLDK